METSLLRTAVVTTAAAFLVLFCGDGVSSEYSVMSPPLAFGLADDPFAKQCTWLFRSNPDDCNTYFQCLHGRSVLKRCPKKLHWNGEGHYCEHKSRSTCQLGKGVNNVLEVYDNAKAHLMKGKWREPCPPNTFKPFPGDCSKYIQCGGSGEKHAMSCSPGLLWDQSIKACNWASAVHCTPSSGSEAGAGTGTAVISYETTTTTTTAAPFLPPFPTITTAPPPGPQPIILSTEQPPTTTTTTEWTTTTTTTTTQRPATSKPSATVYPILIPTSEYKVVCYFTNWAIYRQDKGQFTPKDIDPSKCTHIIYAFACLNPVTYKLEMCDPWIDGKEGKDFYGQITSYRKLGVKVMVAVGGWNDSAYSKWTLMLKDPAKMEIFIKSVAEFLKKFEFDGIDIDYEYPGCPQANCNFDSKFEKQAFVTLVKGLRFMCPPETIITAAVSSNELIIGQAYDVAVLVKFLDFINLMAYDFHGAWEPKTGINAPYQMMPNDEHHLNAIHAVNVFKSLGAPPEKICLGMPMYGQTFTVIDPLTDTGIGAKARGPGPAGPCTKQKGMMAYYEICNQTWTRTVYDKDDRVGPYGVNINDGTWVSYDDQHMIWTKCQFIKENGLGGGMIWALDFDDFKDYCGQGRFPLLTALNHGLRAPPSAQTPYKRTLGPNKIFTSSKKSSSKSNSNQVRRSSSKRQRKTRRPS